MRIISSLTAFAFPVFAIFLLSAPAAAQATRTWVSGVGNDANPCSRTAPCKTFAGAISKTAAGGEIDAIDPGGFGTLTITKSLTVDGGAGQVASVLASGVTGIIISGSGGVVTLRNISINGAGTTSGNIGVNIQNAARVSIENCNIQGFSNYGIINQSTSSGSRLFVSNTLLHDNPGYGIMLTPHTTGAGGLVTLVNVSSFHNGVGGYVGDNTIATATRTLFNNNGTGLVVTSSTAPTTLALDESSVSENAGTGISETVSGGHPIVWISNSQFTGNTGASFSLPSGTFVVSFGNNRIINNGTDVAPSGPATLQ